MKAVLITCVIINLLAWQFYPANERGSGVVSIPVCPHREDKMCPSSQARALGFSREVYKWSFPLLQDTKPTNK